MNEIKGRHQNKSAKKLGENSKLGGGEVETPQNFPISIHFWTPFNQLKGLKKKLFDKIKWDQNIVPFAFFFSRSTSEDLHFLFLNLFF